VIDVADIARPFVAAAKDHRGIGLLVVMIFNLDLHPAVAGEIGPFETVGGIRAIGRDMNHSGCSMTQLESMPMWLGTMSLASRTPCA
jgi:hypothetical protein